MVKYRIQIEIGDTAYATEVEAKDEEDILKDKDLFVTHARFFVEAIFKYHGKPLDEELRKKIEIATMEKTKE